jgi:Membrane protein involved in the export of O-antigen and teichoic acid
MTRTQNSFFNILTNYGSQLLIVLLNFLTRTVFIKELGTSYLGIEGLFTNVLSVLSLVELGFGTSIVFKLYKAIEDNDHPRMRILLDFYRKVYMIIGCVVMVLGLCLLPFLPLLIKDYERFYELGLNAVVVFIIYLFNSAASYWFFAYKTAFVTAQQKNYQLTVVGYAITLAAALAQILVLVWFHNFLLYLAVQIFFVIARNCVYALICDKKYPYIKEKPPEQISKEERHSILKDCYSLLLYKLNIVVVNASDNIVLSAFLGLDTVGLYFNYLTVKTSIIYMLNSVVNSLSASLGSLNAIGNIKWSQLMFRVVNFLSFWIYGVGSIGVAVLLNDFIHCWIGEKFIVDSFSYNGVTVFTPVALLCGIEVYVRGQQAYLDVYRETMGLFQQMKYRPVVSIIVNLIISLVTVKYLGIAGCVLGTVVSYLFVNMVIDPRVIHKYGLKQPIRPYRFRQLLYMGVTIAAGVVCWYLCGLIHIDGWFGFITHGIVCVIVSCVIFTLCFFRTQEFHYLLRTVKDLLTHKPSSFGT